MVLLDLFIVGTSDTPDPYSIGDLLSPDGF